MNSQCIDYYDTVYIATAPKQGTQSKDSKIVHGEPSFSQEFVATGTVQGSSNFVTSDIAPPEV